MTQATKRTSNPSYFWTEEDIDKVRALRELGYTYPSISVKLGKSLDSVKSQAWRSGVPARAVPYTAKEDKLLTDGWRKGDSVEYLMKKTGRSYSAIYARLSRLGISRPAGKSHSGRRF